MIVFGDHLLALDLGEILHGHDAPLVHPSLIADILENFGNIRIKSLIDSGFVVGGDGLVNLRHEPIEKPHDKFIIIAILLEGEDHIAFLQKIVLKSLSVIYRFHFFINSLVNIAGLGQGIFSLHVGHDALLDVLVDEAHLPLREAVFFGEEQDVFEDALGAEDLGVLVGHVVLRERVEGRREDVVADVSQPLLQCIVVQETALFIGVLAVLVLLGLLHLGQVDQYRPVPCLKLEVPHLLDLFPHESVEGIEKLVVLLTICFFEGGVGERVGLFGDQFGLLPLRVDFQHWIDLG